MDMDVDIECRFRLIVVVVGLSVVLIQVVLWVGRYGRLGWMGKRVGIRNK